MQTTLVSTQSQVMQIMAMSTQAIQAQNQRLSALEKPQPSPGQVKRKLFAGQNGALDVVATDGQYRRMTQQSMAELSLRAKPNYVGPPSEAHTALLSNLKAGEEVLCVVSAPIRPSKSAAVGSGSTGAAAAAAVDIKERSPSVERTSSVPDSAGYRQVLMVGRFENTQPLATNGSRVCGIKFALPPAELRPSNCREQQLRDFAYGLHFVPPHLVDRLPLLVPL
jgi:hypothetical protein